MYPGGLWYNELGSVMNISVSGNSVWGSYYTAVGRAVDTYPVAGRIDATPYAYGQAIGWVVSWQNAYLNSHSATTWCGQYQSTADGEEIVALWLLVSETPPDRDWESTQVGQDVFTRTPPSEEQIEVNRHRLGSSHPRKAERS